AFAGGLEQGRNVLPLDDFRRGNTEAGVDAAAEFFGEIGEAGEERFDEGVEDLAGVGETERAAMEEGGAEGILQLENLGADGRLLDAVGNAAGGGADSAMFGDVIEEFQMMYVHREEGPSKGSTDDGECGLTPALSTSAGGFRTQWPVDKPA